MQTSLQFEGAWSIGTSKRGEWVGENAKSVPAPGTHTLSFYHKPASREVNFPKGPRQDLADKRGFPGPGTYTSKNENNRKIGTKMGEKLNIKYSNDVPGPPRYSLKQSQVKQRIPAFSMSYKHDKKIISFSPAPNAYPSEEYENFKLTRSQANWQRKTNTSGFGTSPQRELVNPHRRLDVQRKMRGSLDTPGPGEYMSHKKYSTATGWSIGKSQRNQFNGDDVPGPGNYPKSQQSKSNGFSIGLKLNNGMKTYETCSPGPGTYNPERVKTQQNIKIGGIAHGTLIDEKNIYNPGPQQYDQELQPKQVSYLKTTSIGLAERQDLNQAIKEGVPGPGQYFAANDQKSEGPKHIMAGRLKDKKKYHTMTPGPGQYDPILESSSPAVGSTFGPRSDPIKSKFPNVGPNSYSLEGKKAIGYKFSMGQAKRFSKQKKNYDPGPGSYDIGGTIGKIPEYLLLSKKKNNGLLDF